MNQHAELRARLFVCRRAPQLACWMARKSEKELTRTKLQPQKTRRWRVGPRPRSGCPGPSDSKVQTRPTKRDSALPSYKLSCIYRYSRIPAKKLCRSTQTQGMGWHTAASPNVSDILVPREIQQRGMRELLRHSWQISHCLVFRSDIFFADSVSASFAASGSFSGSFADSCSPSAGTGMGVFLPDGWAN